MTTEVDRRPLDLGPPDREEAIGLPVGDPFVSVHAVDEPSMRQFELVVVIASFAVVVLLGLIK